MNRRAFLKLAAAGAAGLIIGEDLERALWTPGAKTIFLPPVPAPPAFGLADFKPGDIITIEGRYVLDPRSLEPTGYLQQYVVRNVNAGTIVGSAVDLKQPRVQAEYWYRQQPKDRGWSHKRT